MKIVNWNSCKLKNPDQSRNHKSIINSNTIFRKMAKQKLLFKFQYPRSIWRNSKLIVRFISHIVNNTFCT